MFDEFLYLVGVFHSLREIYILSVKFLFINFWYFVSLRELILCVFFLYGLVINPIKPSLREVVILVEIAIALRKALLVCIYVFHG